MWDLAVREDDYDAVDQMLARYSGAPLSYRIPPAYARRDTVTMARLFEEARNLDARQSQIAARYVAIHLEDLDAAERLATLDLQPRRNAAIRLGAQSFLAWLAIARGSWSDARVAFDAAEQMEGGHAIRAERAFAATLPMLAVPPEDVRSVREQMIAWDPSAEPPPAGAPPLAVALRPHLRLYLLGLLSSRLGDSAAALTRAAELDRLPVPASSRPAIAALAATIRADVALRENRPREALDLLQAADGRVPLELVQTRAFANVREFTQEHARFLRARALERLGRHGDARRWMDASFQGSPLELVYASALKKGMVRPGDTP